MFESLAKSFSSALQKLGGRRTISGEDFDLVMEEISQALLDADVNLMVVDDFVERVRSQIIGDEVVKGVLPKHMVVKKVEECLVEVLGNERSELNLGGRAPNVIMMVGLQGVGKTTNSVKVSLKLKKNKKKVLLASLDVYRPAAQQQLQVLAGYAAVDSLPIVKEQMPMDIAARALEAAKREGYDVLMLDTAGRLHVDQEMMEELKSVKELVSPTEVILVLDSMMGQDVLNVVSAFNEQLGITGVILTRVDGDSRGGAVLSMKMAAGCPIKFMSTGEKLEDLDDFYPDRVARRILNMGDVASLVEKAVEAVGRETIAGLQEKAKKGKFDLDDLVTHLKALHKMGGIASILKFIPSFGNDVKRRVSGLINDSMVDQYIAAINSMTKQERSDPSILNGARKLRIAKGAGIKVNVVNALLKQYSQISAMMSKVSKMKGTKANLLKGDDITDLLRRGG